MKEFNIKEFLTELKTNKFIQACGIPLGYKAGFPIFKKKEERVFLSIPYRKYKNTNQKQIFAVMPIEYVVTFELHAPAEIPEKLVGKIKEDKITINATPSGFEIIRYNEKFKDFPFDKPIGVFPHSDLEKIGLEKCGEKVNQIYAAYDNIINGMLCIEEDSIKSKKEFKQLLNELIEPSLKPMYKMLDADFAEKYFEKEK